MLIRIIIISGLIALVAPARSQSRSGKVTISGTVIDHATGEFLIGATVFVKELATGTVSNAYGFYSLTLPPGSYALVYSYLGYESITQLANLTEDRKVDVGLQEDTSQLDEVVVTADALDESISSSTPGRLQLSVKEIQTLPVLLGEKDPLKILQLLPGIKSAGEGNSGFHVRGGNSDQNLVLLDEAPVYNPSHLLGFFSTFNADAIKDLSVYKGGMPAQYGGRLSSVLDVRMNEGNNQEFKIGGGIGLIASRVYAEGPLTRDRGSFLITARRTYADLFLKLSDDPALNQNTLYFYDINMKANYKLSEKDKVYLSGYFGRDNFSLESAFGIDWGNATGTLRWNHLINDRLFVNTSFIYSNYSYNVSINNGSNNFNLKSSIEDFNLKHEYSYFIDPKNSLRIGLNVIHHTITPRERIAASAESSINNTTEKDRHSTETSAYLSHEWDPTSAWNFEYGLRLTSFAALGGANDVTLDEIRQVQDTISRGEWDVVEHYINLEPRLSASYTFDESLSLKASFTRNVQNLHLISNSTTSAPNDRWIQSSNNVKPEIADQISLGLFKTIEDRQYQFSSEFYYKTMKNQIDYKDAADLVFSEQVETQLVFGKGRAYGAEILFRKNSGKLTGWIGYTLSKTEKRIDGINNDNWYPARQDRTHDISVVGMYALSSKWNLSAAWVYSTGNAVSFPTAKYIVDNSVIFYYSERNGYRMPAYHRLDLGATWIIRKTKERESDLTFSVYNAYGRANPYSIDFEQSIDDASITEIQRLTLFKFVPSITYNFKF